MGLRQISHYGKISITSERLKPKSDFSWGPHSQQKSRRDSDRVRNFDTMPPYSAIQSAKSVAFQTHLIHAKPIQIPAAHI